MFKKLTSILTITVILLGTLSLTGCLGAGDPPGTYRNDAGNFSVVFPENWDYKENFMNLPVMAFTPLESETDQFQENISISYETVGEEMTLDDYYDFTMESIKDMSSFFLNFKEIENSDMILDEVPSKYSTYTYTMQEVEIKVMFYLLIKNGRAYAITGTTTTETFDQYKTELEKIAQSFRAK